MKKRQFLVTIEGDPDTVDATGDMWLKQLNFTGIVPLTANGYRLRCEELEPDHTEEFNTLMTTLEMEREAVGEVFDECSVG